MKRIKVKKKMRNNDDVDERDDGERDEVQDDKEDGERDEDEKNWSSADCGLECTLCHIVCNFRNRSIWFESRPIYRSSR